MSLAYKVEELLAIRDSVSESAVSIDRFADEDVIKEHVLRPSASASANLTSRESNRSLRPPAVAGVAAAAAIVQKRPSPSPSIKRGKAEKLLKEHGSPPGIRVTAGGRIVPSDLPPLGTSRLGDNSYRSQILRATQGNVMSAQAQSNANCAARIEIIGGQPVVFIGDRMFALPAMDTGSARLPSGEVPVMNSNMKHTGDPATLTNALPETSFGQLRESDQTPFAGLDLPTLKAQQLLKKQELRSVEQTEVLQASHRSDSWRASIIEQKRCLIVELDALRKRITALEMDNATQVQPNPFPGQMAGAPGMAPMPSILPQLQQPVPQAMYAFPAPNPYAPMMMYPFPGFPAADLASFAPAPTTTPHSPGSGSRRSHAVEIKPPREETKKQSTSGLDPKSPTYEPESKTKSGQGITIPTTSLPKPSAWAEQQVSRADKHEPRSLSQKPSLSSIDTTDFFPTNTHEHSSTRVAPGTDEVKQPSKQNVAVPSTPEKHWPASPWNESLSGRSRNNEPAPKLTSWPEAFGKQPSLSSLRQDGSGQSVVAMLERASAGGGNISYSALNSNVLARTNSEARAGNEENWPFSSEPAAHVLSTYQEGYQAGYNHVGIPDSPEVLQGYIQGLLHFLSDETKKRQLESSARMLYRQGTISRTPSLRALLAGSMPHDSAVSMTFNRYTNSQGSQENIRSARANPATDSHRDLARSPHGSAKDIASPYEHRNEGVLEPRPRNTSNINFVNSATMVPDRVATGHHDVYKKTQGDSGALRAESIASTGALRSVFGNQVQNRGYGMPPTSQRFHAARVEVGANRFDGDVRLAARPLAGHRLSGLDGAMDDLAEMINDTHIQDGRAGADKRPMEAPFLMEEEEKTTSCFKASGGKGKQKATSPPAKAVGVAKDSASSPHLTPSSSPKKSGEHSPAKVKLEQVTNKFRRAKKDDPRTMSPEERMKRTEKWRQRFQQLKRTEMDEIEAYTKSRRSGRDV